MKYDFDHLIERKNTASLKWDALESQFGTADVLPMWVADMDFPAPPCVIEALQQRINHGVFGYTLREYYYEALVGWLKRRHDWDVNTDWIVNAPGVVPAIALIIDTFTAPGDGIVIQRPVYYPFENLIRKNGRKLVNNPLKLDGSRYVMDYEDLERRFQAGAKMFILCNPHNPVGRVWTKEELTRLGELCDQYDVLVVADEIHGDLIMPGYTHTPFASLSHRFREHSLTCVAPSKSFNLAGLQTSSVIIPNKELRTTYQTAQQRLSIGGANTFGVIAADSAYRNGDEWLGELLKYVAQNLSLLSDFINTHIPELSVIPLEGTYLVWIDCRKLGLRKELLDELFLTKAKVALDMGHMFGPEGEGFTRINIACPRSVLETALQQILTTMRNDLPEMQKTAAQE